MTACSREGWRRARAVLWVVVAPLVAGACDADRMLAPYGARTRAERVRVDVLIAEVAALPACADLEALPGDGWQPESLTVLPGSFPLPPGFTPGVLGKADDEGYQYETPAWRTGFVRYWHRTDYAWVGLQVHRGDEVVVRGVARRLDGTLQPDTAPEEPACAREVGGRRARSQDRAFYAPVLKDTLFYTHVVLAAAPDAVLSALVGAHTRAARAELLTALAAAQLEAPAAEPVGENSDQRRSPGAAHPR